MSAVAKHKYARISAQKTRLVADMIRGKKVDKAIDMLTYSPKKAATLVLKVLESAIANAEHNEGDDVDELFVEKIFIDEGPVYKRFKAGAKGRAKPIEKRNCHITIVVSQQEQANLQ